KKITMTAPANTTLYYTTNGTTPKRASKTYVKPGKTKPISISKKTTLKVMAVKNGCSRSDVVTRVYGVK
ncbi:MAG: chitobiase/beta-hexosaminidase C-terminal domain-containing protein, partial [Oscillospiraceae bacterium]|nr:chitobiase/beta-hexosaminidase C-terminal domain-containing protein [Oscillospiraceae bacterium]